MNILNIVNRSSVFGKTVRNKCTCRFGSQPVFCILIRGVQEECTVSRNITVLETAIDQRKLMESFLPSPWANNCRVEIVGLQVPFSMRLILD